MTDIHSCSYFCQKVECIKQQRDALRERLNTAELDLFTLRKRLAEQEALADGRLEIMQSDRKQHLDYRDRVEGRLK